MHSRPSYHKIFNILRCTQKIKQYLLNSNVVYIFYEHCIQAFLFCFYKLLKRSLIFCQGVVSMLNNTTYWKWLRRISIANKYLPSNIKQLRLMVFFIIVFSQVLNIDVYRHFIILQFFFSRVFFFGLKYLIYFLLFMTIEKIGNKELVLLAHTKKKLPKSILEEIKYLFHPIKRHPIFFYCNRWL